MTSVVPTARRAAGRAGLTLLLVLVLLLGSSSCGEGDGSIRAEFAEYCSVAQENQKVFSDDGTGVALLNGIETLERIADLAPADIADEWQTFLVALTGLRSAITSVGLQPSDFSAGEPPATTSATDREVIAAAAQRLAQNEVTAAASGIEQHAKDVCKFQLGL